MRLLKTENTIMEEGTFVYHSNKPEWGLGKVIKLDKQGYAYVFFLEAGMKRLANHPEFFTVINSISSHPLLDGITSINDKSTSKYRSLKHLVEIFLNIFPKGFNDLEYFTHEREYKYKAHVEMKALLDEPVFAKLIAENQYGELYKRTSRIMNMTNLVFPNEKMALRDGLATPAEQQEFITLLYAMLYKEDDPTSHFHEFARFLKKIGASRWTNQTYFLFIRHPEKYLFMKPAAFQQGAEICAFDIKYKSEPNWTTYSALLSFGQYLKNELSGYGPNLQAIDLIDVQSFIFCVAQEIYEGIQLK